MSYRTNGSSTVNQTVAAITSVDLVNNLAEAMIRDGSTVSVHTDIHVGAVSVTPKVGEQWVVENAIGGWRLLTRLPYNDPAQAQIPAVEGQSRLGTGSGPVELSGTSINAYSPVVLQNKATTTRPSASSAGAGAMIYDSTLKKPIWSDGSLWHDASGTAV